MRYIYIILLNLFFALSISSCLRHNSCQSDPLIQAQNAAFFTSVPLTFSSRGSPHLEVQIGNQIYPMKLDLGLRGDLSVESAFIDQIDSKQFIHCKPMYGFRGKKYQTNLFRIPSVRIGTFSFLQRILQENCEESRKDSVVTSNGEDLFCQRAGRIGWELFKNSKVLIDVKNSQIAFCDSLETLKKCGYAIEDFIKVPLLIERGLVEFEALTSNGFLRCVLDTGTTWNIFNAEAEEGKSIEQVMWESANIMECPSFVIGNEEFGALTFHRIPIKIPIQIEAILGMEFFNDHLVFLDFVDNFVYFKKL